MQYTVGRPEIGRVRPDLPLSLWHRMGHLTRLGYLPGPAELEAPRLPLGRRSRERQRADKLPTDRTRSRLRTRCLRSSPSCACGAPTRMKKVGIGIAIGIGVDIGFEPRLRPRSRPRCRYRDPMNVESIFEAVTHAPVVHPTTHEKSRSGSTSRMPVLPGGTGLPCRRATGGPGHRPGPTPRRAGLHVYFRNRGGKCPRPHSSLRGVALPQ